MASVCGSLCIENVVQLAKIVCTIALDEIKLFEINPFMDFVLQKIVMTLVLEVTRTKISQGIQVLLKTVDKNLHHFLVLLKIFNLNKLE
jgi:hypothetical protein